MHRAICIEQKVPLSTNSALVQISGTSSPWKFQHLAWSVFLARRVPARAERVLARARAWNLPWRTLGMPTWGAEHALLGNSAPVFALSFLGAFSAGTGLMQFWHTTSAGPGADFSWTTTPIARHTRVRRRSSLWGCAPRPPCGHPWRPPATHLTHLT